MDVATWNPGNSGLLWVTMITDPEKRDVALESFWREISVLKKVLIEDSRILKAQRQAMVGEINNRKTMSGQASRIGSAEVVVGDIDYPKVYLENLQKVPPKICNAFSTPIWSRIG